MRVVQCDVMINGEIHMQIAEKIVTIPELALLRKRHGEAAVYNIRPMPKDWKPQNEKEKRLAAADQQSEKDRLRGEYGRNKQTGAYFADEEFPGAIARLPDSLTEIGLDPATMAQTLKDKAKQLMAEAERLSVMSEEDLAGEARDGARGSGPKKSAAA